MTNHEFDDIHDTGNAFAAVFTTAARLRAASAERCAYAERRYGKAGPRPDSGSRRKVRRIEAAPPTPIAPGTQDNDSNVDDDVAAAVEDFLAGGTESAMTASAGGDPGHAADPADPAPACLYHADVWKEAGEYYRKNEKSIFDAVFRDSATTIETLIDEMVEKTADTPEARRRLMTAFTMFVAIAHAGGHIDMGDVPVSDDDFRRMFLVVAGIAGDI